MSAQLPGTAARIKTRSDPVRSLLLLLVGVEIMVMPVVLVLVVGLFVPHDWHRGGCLESER